MCKFSSRHCYILTATAAMEKSKLNYSLSSEGSGPSPRAWLPCPRHDAIIQLTSEVDAGLWTISSQSQLGLLGRYQCQLARDRLSFDKGRG